MKNILKYGSAALMAMAGLFAQSCSLDDAAKIPLVELGAPTKEFIVESLAGDVAIPVYSNGAYHVENVAEGQEWIALDKWEGNGDDTLYVEYTFNEEFKRMAGLVLCSDVDERRDTIYIKQKGLIEAELSLQNSSVIAAGKGGVTEVPVKSNIPFEYMDVNIAYTDEASGEWINAAVIDPDPYGGNSCTLRFETVANPEPVRPRTASVSFSFTDGWGDSVAILVNFVQRNSEEGLGEVMSFKALKDNYSTGKPIEDYVILDGVVVSNTESGNAGENEQTTTSVIDYSGSKRTIYIQSPDASEGIAVIAQSEDDNNLKQFDRVQILLHGATINMLEEPERYEIGGFTKNMVVSQVAGSKSDIPVKEKYMNELSDQDIYTYVTIKDCELPVRKGSICPVNEGYSIGTGASRISKYPLLVRDINGNSMYMYTNTVCVYRSDGTRLPYGSGKISGVIVHERFSRFEWKDGADPADIEFDPTLGNIGRYQIRHQCKEDVWGQMNDSVEDSFSALLTEYRFWNPDTENEVALPTYGENGWLTHTYQEKYTGDPALDYTMATYKQHFWGAGTYDYLGPIGNSSNYIFGDNWGNRNGIGVVLDPAKEHYNPVMSSLVSNNPDGTVEWCGPNATSKDAVNNSKRGAGGINNQSTSMCGKGNVYGSAFSAFASHFWWNDETQRPYAWLVKFSTEGIATNHLSMQISVLNTQQTWYSPRYWIAEWAETDSQAAADDKLWNRIGEYTIPDVSVWSNTLYSSIVAFKSINFDLPLEMLGKAEVYVRLRPVSDVCSDGSEYANSVLKESSKKTALAAEHASALSYFAIRYNK